MNPFDTDLAVTLSADLDRHLRSEAARLDIPLEWLVASIVVDSIEDDLDESDELATEIAFVA